MTSDYVDALETVVGGLHAIVAAGSVHPGYIRLNDSTLVAAADHITDYITAIRAMESDARLAHPRGVPVPPASPGLIAQMVRQARLEDTRPSGPAYEIGCAHCGAMPGEWCAPPSGWLLADSHKVRQHSIRACPTCAADPGEPCLETAATHVHSDRKRDDSDSAATTGWTPRLIVGGLNDQCGEDESLDQLVLFGAET